MVWIIKIIPKINIKFCDVLILDGVTKSLSVLFVIAALKSRLSRASILYIIFLMSVSLLWSLFHPLELRIIYRTAHCLRH